MDAASNGRFKQVYHFDAKADAADYIERLGIPFTFFMPGYFASNQPSFMNPNQDGALTQYLPIPGATKIPIFDASEDTGKFIKAILLNPDKTLGRRVRGASEYISFDDMAATLTKLRPKKGKGANMVQIPREKFKESLVNMGQPESVAEDLTEMFEYFEEPGYFAGDPLDTELLGEPATSWADFVEQEPKWKE